jgi:hypothetical protein
MMLNGNSWPERLHSPSIVVFANFPSLPRPVRRSQCNNAAFTRILSRTQFLRTTGCDKDYAATGGEGYSIPGKRGEVLKDEIAQEIVSELRLIREELQNLTMAVRSASTSRNSENSDTGKPPKFYPRRAANPPDVRHSQGHKLPRSPQRGEPRSQWHQNAPKDTR